MASIEVKIAEYLNPVNARLLQYENKVRKELKNSDFLIEFVKGGDIESKFFYTILIQSGPSIEHLKETHRTFSVPTVILTIYELVKILEKIHKSKFLVRDLRPDNVSIGYGQRAKDFYILDVHRFKKYWDDRIGQHIMYKEGKPFLGDALFGSVNEHLGLELSRRDDLESLAYLALYMLKGSLDWEDELEAGDKRADRYPNILAKKINVTADEMFGGYPYEFALLLKYARALRFKERPDYDWLKGIFKGLFENMDLSTGITFDWIMKERKKQEIERMKGKGKGGKKGKNDK